VGTLLLGAPLAAAAQLPPPVLAPDSLAGTARLSVLRRAAHWAGQPAGQRVLVPAGLFVAGVLTTRRVAVVNSDEEVRHELDEHVVPVRTTIDDQLRHVPAAAALGLSLAGVKGKHSTVNPALLFAINNTLTSNLKNLTRVERPGGNGDFSSFPSQHASAAFSAARFLDREYGETSNWYRVGGYSVATGVAALRMIKGNHWLSDVLAGAGVGLASTELAYWIYPRVQKVLVKGLQDRALVLPYYQSGAAGLTAVLVLR
jgi:membrane-associated phospholipid phosphatase